MRCLLTGATGLLGSFLLKELEDCEVFILSRNQHMTSISSHHHFLPLDLMDEKFVEKLPKAIDAVIHLAQPTHYRDFPEKAQEIAHVNTISTLKLLEYARKAGARSFVYASSGIVYGSDKKAVSEDEPLLVQRDVIAGPLGFYYTTKLASELFVEAYAHCLHAVILRFFFVYGPNQRNAMLMPRLVDSILHGRPIQLKGKEGSLMNPIYASDAAKAIKKALYLNKSEIFDVAGPEALSLKKIALIMGECLNKQIAFEIDNNAIETNLLGNIQKQSQMLCPPVIGFRQGIQAYINTLEEFAIR